MLFHDRTYAAFLLEEKLHQFKSKNGVVLAIPRGGVPIGYQLAHLLRLPLDIIVSKKIPHPMNPEFAVGSVCGDEVELDDISTKSISPQYLKQQIARLKKEAKEKYKLFRGDRVPLPLKGKIAIVTDDGIATGDTMLSAVRAIRKQKPSKIVVAVPVASTSASRLLTPEADEFICLSLPRDFRAVGEFYENFSEVPDEEVMRLLHKADTEVDLANGVTVENGERK
jgi:putative phosphoribosyl transferase